MMVGAVRTTSSRPGEVTGGERLLQDLGVERLFAAEERLQRGNGDGGVLGLVRAVQRHQQVLVAAGDALDGDHLAADGDGAGFDAELHAFEAERHVDFLGLLQQDLGRVDRLRGADEEAAGLDDAGLLVGDVLGGVAQQVRVVQRDRGDHGHLAVADVRGVGDAAQAHLDDGDVDRLVGEDREAQDGQALEVGQPGLALGLEFAVHDLQVGPDLVPDPDEGLIRHRGAVDADPFGDLGQVRARVAAGAQAVGAQPGLDHPGRGGLAVGAGDVDDRERLVRLPQDFHGPVQRGEPRLHLVFRRPAQQLGVDAFYGEFVGHGLGPNFLGNADLRFLDVGRQGFQLDGQGFGLDQLRVGQQGVDDVLRR